MPNRKRTITFNSELGNSLDEYFPTPQQKLPRNNESTSNQAGSSSEENSDDESNASTESYDTQQEHNDASPYN